jgi:hypothetical protein
LIINELSKKERAQIIDLLTNWAEELVDECWKWNHGQAPPLRLLCEIGIVGAEWLNYTSTSMKNEQQDWRTNLPSWLGAPGDRLGENKSIERLYYFGWESINEVTVATKDDEALSQLKMMKQESMSRYGLLAEKEKEWRRAVIF